MPFDFISLPSATIDNIQSGTLENAIYQLARYIDYIEREFPQANTAGSNKVSVQLDASTGAIRITANLNYTETVNSAGELVPTVSNYLQAIA
jgi:hypothetical protein